MTKTVPFNARLDKRTGCWKWTGSKNKSGYGKITRQGITHIAHRYAYEQANHCVLRKDQHVLHTCDEPSCCRPDHLFIGTHADNMKDMAMKLRNGRKLTPDDVRQIRSQYQPYVCTQKTLAETYGVSIKLIQDILNNKIWQYV